MLSETDLLKIDNFPRRYSAAERKAYVTQWEQSQLSRSEFCRREGLILKNFYVWVKRHSEEPQKKPKPKLTFIPLKANPEMGAHAGSSIEIYLPNGLRCCFKTQIEIQTVIKLVD